MRIGLSLMFQHWADYKRFATEPDGAPTEADWEFYRDELAVGDLAEPLGFDSLWTIEHHFSVYGMIPNPLQLLSYFAARTSKVDLGTMVAVVPWHDPVRLAEQIALLDNLIGPERSLTVGLGRGAGAREFAGLRVPMDRSRKLFAEGLDVIRLALTQPVFSYHGELIQLDDVSVRPRPRDPSLLERALASFRSPESLEVAAASGLGMLFATGEEPTHYTADRDRFNEVRAEHELPPIQPTLWQSVYCAPSEDDAIAGGQEFMGNVNELVNWHYGLNDTKHFERAGDYDFWAEQARAVAGQSVREMREAYARTQICGTPEQCIERIFEIREALDPHELLLTFRLAGMSLETTRRSLELFAEKVLPKVRD